MSEITRGLPTKQQFKAQVYKTFRNQLSNGRSVEMTLSAVEEHVSSPTHENFSLFLVGPTDMPSEQSIYTLGNEELGTFDLFLVPIRKDSNGLVLEAVINQIPEIPADPSSAQV